MLLGLDEYSSSEHGIYTLTLAKPRVLTSRSPLTAFLPAPDLSSWPARAGKALKRAPLLVKFTRELQQGHRLTLWALIGASVVLGFTPAAELYFARALIDTASQVGLGLPLDVPAFATSLAGRVTTALSSEILSRLIWTLELSLLSSLSLRIQSLILDLNLTLPSDTLALPSTQRKMTALSDLASSSTYRRVFNPLAPFSLVNSLLSLGAGALMLYRMLNPVNAACLVISVGGLLLDENGAGHQRAVAEHLDVTNDGYLRFQTLFKLGTSKSLRREVHTLGLGPHILESAAASLAQLGSTSTHSPAESMQEPITFLTVARSLSHTIATTTFILYSAFLRPRDLLCNFAELAIVEQAVWRIRCDWQASKRGAVEVEEGLEKLEFLYEPWPEREKIHQGPLYEPTRTITEGRMGERVGMEIEFRGVSLTYEGSDTPALKDVSFTIHAGEFVSIVGHNGSGKTTIVSLLAQEVKPTKGVVLVNGTPIEEWEQTSLASALSFAFQASPFLPFTVRELVTLGRPVSDAALQAALQVSGAIDVVNSLEDGLDSYVTSSSSSTTAGAGGHNSFDYFSLPQVVPRPMPPPTLEWIDAQEARQKRRRSVWGHWEDVGAEPNEKKLDEAAVETEKGCVEGGPAGARQLRKTERSTTEYPIFTRGGAEDGLEGNITFTNHAPVPFILSGGQWQRLQLCRSLLSAEHATLVWDEPFAALDPIIESSLAHYISHTLRAQRTVVLVTHRFGVTRDADKVLVMDGGSLVEQGTHDELMRSAEGVYARLWELQAEGFVDVSREGEHV